MSAFGSSVSYAAGTSLSGNEPYSLYLTLAFWRHPEAGAINSVRSGRRKGFPDQASTIFTKVYIA